MHKPTGQMRHNYTRVGGGGNGAREPTVEIGT